jgi:glycosyltransferase involved in cell wall biosynthesis
VSPAATASAPRTPRRLRVLFALAGLHRVHRGAEVAFESIARALARSPGVEVTLIGTGAERPGEPYRFRGVPCIPRERFEGMPSIPALRAADSYEELSFAPGLFRAYAPAAYDVTCTCAYPFTNWVLRAPWRRRAAPAHVFITQNGDWPARAGNSEFRFFRCEGLVCTNPDYYERNRSSWRSVLIPNGVDTDRFSPGRGDRARFGLPEGVPVALIVSALIESKRVEAGLRSVAAVPGLHVVVAGDGPLRAAVDACGRALLGERFRRITVGHEAMPDLYRSADVLLHMSQNESSALTYVEALATGLPVVAHETPVTRWTFEDQAFLVDTSGPEATAGAVIRALAARSPGQIAGRRALAERRFSWSAIAASYATFLGEVVASRR